MVLNYIWIAFFIIAFIVALGKLIFTGDTQIFTEIINSTFSSSKTAFEVSLGLTGVLSLWLGIMKRSYQCTVALVEPGILPPVSRYPQGTPRNGIYFYEYVCQYAGT